MHQVGCAGFEHCAIKHLDVAHNSFASNAPTVLDKYRLLGLEVWPLLPDCTNFFSHLLHTCCVTSTMVASELTCCSRESTLHMSIPYSLNAWHADPVENCKQDACAW